MIGALIIRGASKVPATPFSQSLLLAAIPGFIGIGTTLALFYVMFKTDLMFDMMERMWSIMGKHHERDYHCTCSRCKFELRTKKGMKAWKKDHRWKKDEMV